VVVWLIGFIYARGGLVTWVCLCSWWFGYLGLFMLVVVWLLGFVYARGGLVN
jgi:hypothetical protein